jgi:uncharacterized protein
VDGLERSGVGGDARRRRARYAFGDNDRVPPGEDDPHVFRAGGISYLRVPAGDPGRSAAFYEAVFGWTLGGDPRRPSFEDGTGHVIGHFGPGEVAGEAGLRPYVYVESLRDTLDRVVFNGGEIVESAYPEGDLSVATFRDPAGNVVGVWQRGPA